VNGVTAIARLQALSREGRPVVTTSEVSALLGSSTPAANRMLGRLAAARLVTPLRHGMWWIGDRPDPYLVAGFASDPFPSYLSFQSALYRHGLIEQIPAVVYTATLGRSRRIATSAVTISAHHLAPEFWGGFVIEESGLRMATPEKALVDVCYVSSTKTRLFASLPELTLPPRFSKERARSWARRIPSKRLRTIVETRLEGYLERGQWAA
jgi:predicted transcriptional regulator of viral defense system